jgi:DtxR family Mn-dependent transcriptional regulator
MVMLSERSEDLLKAIYELQQEGAADRISTSSLAKVLGIADASVTGLLKKLVLYKPKLIEYRRYRGVALTDAGQKRALKLVRRHRLLESFLAQNLGYSWDEVHQEADALEHVITENFGDRIAASLKNPITDPHGSPIPKKDGTVVKRVDLPLSRMDEGDEATISRVSDDDPELLRYLDDLGLKPQTSLQLIARGHFDDIYHVQDTHTGSSHHLSRFVADQLFVIPKDET